MDNRILQIILRAKDEASKTLKQVGDQTQGLSKLFKDNYKEAGLMSGAILGGLALAGKYAVSNAAAYEQNRIAFESMLGSADEARRLLQKVSDFAKQTPFELPQVVEGSKRLLAYNIEASKIIPTFRMLGDIAAGVGTDKLPQLITAFGQVQAKGKLMGTELLQFTEAGVGLGQALQKSFGVTREELEKMISSGDVTADQVTEALQTMTSEGGLFFQGMERQSKSFNGIMSNIADTFGKFVRDVAGISEQGDIREGSLFFYLKQGAETLLPMIEAAGPKVAAFFETITKNKTAILAIAGAIGGLMVLALGALVAAFWAPLAVMAAFAAAGALVAVAVLKIHGAVKRGVEIVRDLGNYFRAVVTDTDHLYDWLAIVPGPIAIVAASIGDLIEAIMALPQRLREWRDTFIEAVNSSIARAQELAAQVGRAIAAIIVWFQQLPGRVAAFLYDLFINRIPYAVGFAAGYLSTAIPAMIENVVTWFATLPERVAMWFDQMGTRTRTQVTDTGTWLSTKTQETVDAVVRWFQELPGRVGAIFDQVRQWIVDKVTAAWGWLSGEVSAWAGRVAGFLSSLPGRVAQIFNDMKDAAIGKVVELWNALTGWWDKIRGIFDNIRSAAEKAIGAVQRGFDAGRNAGMRFADGGWVPYTGNAVVHAGEFVLSRDMLAGRQPIPAEVPIGNGRGVTINMGGVHVNSMADVDSMAYRLGFHLQTAGNL